MLRPVMSAIVAKPPEVVASGERAIMLDMFKIAMQRVIFVCVLSFCLI